ncbi:hypothetical protein VTJ49DRAFT_1562 [Mycothermus thermophilus]|uniref:Clr5 domain-containing protein n=1 Tax=Humicola insolens TaxID=85995 RepID=A0ABR3VP86_HUMIN
MVRSLSPDTGHGALLAAAESLTGLLLDDDPRAFIKEETATPGPDDRFFRSPPAPQQQQLSQQHQQRQAIKFKKSVSQKLTDVPVGKSRSSQTRVGRQNEKGSRPKTSRNPPAPGEPFMPRRVEDWEPWKSILYDLYITQNRILRDIIDIMEKKHNLHATPKMYKNQFARWGFFKYAVKKRSRPKPDSPSSQSSDDSLDGAIILSRHDLLHPDDSSRNMQAGLTAVRRFIHGHIDHDVGHLQVEEVAGFVDPCYRYFKLAMDLFDLHENLEGGRVLRLAFLQIERKMSKPTMKSFSDLCLLVPHLLLESNRRDILAAYLHYVSGLASVKFGKHPVSELAAALTSLIDARPADMMRYIMLLAQINADTVAALPGVLDRNAQWAHNQYLACQRTAYAPPRRRALPSPPSSPASSPSEEPVPPGTERHDHHTIRLEAQSVYWAQKLVMRDPQSDELASLWLRRQFPPDFAPRCEALLARLHAAAESGMLPMAFARMIEGLYVGWLADYYETVEDWDQVFRWGRRGLELSTDEHSTLGHSYKQTTRMKTKALTILAVSLSSPIITTVQAAPALSTRSHGEVSWYEIGRNLTCTGRISDGSITCLPGVVESVLIRNLEDLNPQSTTTPLLFPLTWSSATEEEDTNRNPSLTVLNSRSLQPDDGLDLGPGEEPDGPLPPGGPGMPPLCVGPNGGPNARDSVGCFIDCFSSGYCNARCDEFGGCVFCVEFAWCPGGPRRVSAACGRQVDGCRTSLLELARACPSFDRTSDEMELQVLDAKSR